MILSEYRKLIDVVYKNGNVVEPTVAKSLSPAEYFAYHMLREIKCEIASRMDSCTCAIDSSILMGEENESTVAVYDALEELKEYIDTKLTGDDAGFETALSPAEVTIDIEN